MTRYYESILLHKSSKDRIWMIKPGVFCYKIRFAKITYRLTKKGYLKFSMCLDSPFAMGYVEDFWKDNMKTLVPYVLPTSECLTDLKLWFSEDGMASNLWLKIDIPEKPVDKYEPVLQSIIPKYLTGVKDMMDDWEKDHPREKVDWKYYFHKNRLLVYEKDKYS